MGKRTNWNMYARDIWGDICQYEGDGNLPIAGAEANQYVALIECHLRHISQQFRRVAGREDAKVQN